MIFRFWGMTLIAEGCLNMIRGVIGNQQPLNHQIILGLLMGIKIANVIIFGFIYLDPGMIPWIDVFQSPPVFGTIVPEAFSLAKGLIILVMVITVFSMLEEIYWIVKLEQYKI